MHERKEGAELPGQAQTSNHSGVLLALCLCSKKGLAIQMSRSLQ